MTFELNNSTTAAPTVKRRVPIGKLGIFRVEQIDLRFSNGEERLYYRIVSKSDAVTVLAIDGDDLLLIGEYSAGTLDYRLGFVRGGIEEGDQPEESAHRELAEEVGYTAQRMEFLRTIHNSTGYQTGQMHIFLARDLTPVTQPVEGDEPEPLQIVRWPLAQLDELLTHPEFTDSRNLVALYTLRDVLAAEEAARNEKLNNYIAYQA